MFVVSLSSQKVKKVILPVVCACAISAVFLITIMRCNSPKPQNTELLVNNNAADITEVLQFISDFGWEVDPEPDEIREVIIPSQFDEVYENYNQIQLKQGYDLSEYSGERAKSWTFTVLNYPGFEDEEYIKINILIYNGKVIGGDVCSVKLDGFMHGFAKE